MPDATILVFDCKNKRYSRQAIWAAGAARARSIPAAGCDERATKPATQRANGYIAYFCNQALARIQFVFTVSFHMIFPTISIGLGFARFAKLAGPVIGPFVGMEVLSSFFLEAGFLGIMLCGLKRVGPRLHFFAPCMVACPKAQRWKLRLWRTSDTDLAVKRYI